jgi:lysyl-tRNA synthetase class 2
LEDYSAHEGKSVTVAGRLTSWRKQGALAFGHIQDQTGTIQLMLRRTAVAPTDPGSGLLGYEDVNLLDVGDIVEATGTVGKTQRGEISVMVERLRILTKSLRPLPEKWSGVKDREIILRKRYLDTIAAPEHRDSFTAISRMLYEIRAFFHQRGFLEFHTPIIQPQYGGGTARPFLTHVNALDCDMYLAISHELYLKRLITAGFDKVYTIGRYFRNEGIDRSHHPEFSMIETMTAYENYEYNMDLIEDLFRHIALAAFGRSEFQVRGHTIDFAKPWNRISMADAILAELGRDFRQCLSLDQAHEWLREIGLHESQVSIGHAMVHAFEEKVEPTLIHPTLVYGHPIEISPLAKPMQQDPRFVERFEIFIAGMECGDNWSEQNDPVSLLEAWKKNYRPEVAETGEFHPLDFDFIETLEHGMPPTTGIGPGLERMAMIFTEQEDIYDVIFFPMMKPHLSPVNRSIYGVEEEPRESQVVTELVMSLEEFRTLLVKATPVGRVRVQAVARKACALATIHSTVDGLAEGAVIAVSAQPADVTAALQARFPDLSLAT